VKIQHLTINNNLYQSPVFKEFYEEAQRCNRVIAEARRYLLVEEQLNAQQIDKIFRLVADGAAAGKNTDSGEVDMGSNKTALGKVTGAVGDALKGLKAKWDSLKDWVSKSGPVSGFDVAFDQLQGSLLNAMGGEGGKVANAMQSYRQFAVKHPVAQGLILVGLAALLGTAMGGGTLALAGVTFGIRTLDALLKGHKFSSSTYKGAKAAAIMTVASLGIKGIIDNFDPDPGPGPGPGPGPDVVPPGPDVVPPGPDVVPPGPDLTPTDYTIARGDTLSQLASDNGITVQDIMDANPQITNPNGMTDAGRLLQPGDVIKMPQSMDFSPPPVYAGGTGTLADTIQKMMTGQYSGDANIALNALKADPSQLKLLSPEQAAWAKSQMAKLAESARRAQWIDREATVRSWALNESLGRSRGGVMLTQAGVDEVFRRIDEGVWDSIKKGASAVGGAISNAASKGWNAATNKITYDSLGMNWRSINPNRLKGNATGMTADSRDIEVFLRRQGVKDPLIASVYKEMGIPVATVATQGADAQDQSAGADDYAKSLADMSDEELQSGLNHLQRQDNPTPEVTSSIQKVQQELARRRGDTQAGTAPDAGGKVGDANDLIRDLEADKAKKTTGGAPAVPAGGATPSWADPKSADYVGRREVARRQAAAPAATAGKPDYSKTMPGYGKVNMTMKTPTGAAAPAAPAKAPAAPVTGAPGVRGTVPSAQPAMAGGLDDFPSAEEIAQLEKDSLATSAERNKEAEKYGNRPEPYVANQRGYMKEQRRTYGGKYVRESAAQRTAREFEFYLKNLG